MAIQSKYLKRLIDNLQTAGIAVIGIDVNGKVNPTNLQTTAQPTIDAFVQTDAAQQAWLDSKEPDIATFRDAVTSAILANNTYLGIASPTNAQVVAQVQRLTQQNTAIMRALHRWITKSGIFN